MPTAKKTATKTTQTKANSTVASTAAEVTASAAVVTPAKTQSDTVVIALNFVRSITFDVDINGVTEFLTVNGNATHLRGLDMGVLPGVGSYGLTFGVPRYLWDAVVAKYGGMPIFKNGLIFAKDSENEAKAAVKDHSTIANGFEAQPQTI